MSAAGGEGGRRSAAGGSAGPGTPAGGGPVPGAPALSPAVQAFEELEHLVRLLGEELAAFRRRALEAERRWQAAEQRLAVRAGAASADGHAATEPDRATLAARVALLETENADLRARLAEAAERTRAMAERLRFLRQQEEVDGGR